MGKAAEDIDSDIEFLKGLAESLTEVLNPQSSPSVAWTADRLHLIAAKLDVARASLREPAALENLVEDKLTGEVRRWAEGEEYGSHAAQCDATSIAALWLLQRRIKNAASMAAVGGLANGAGGMMLAALLKKDG